MLYLENFKNIGQNDGIFNRKSIKKSKMIQKFRPCGAFFIQKAKNNWFGWIAAKRRIFLDRWKTNKNTLVSTRPHVTNLKDILTMHSITQHDTLRHPLQPTFVFYTRGIIYQLNSPKNTYNTENTQNIDKTAENMENFKKHIFLKMRK